MIKGGRYHLLVEREVSRMQKFQSERVFSSSLTEWLGQFQNNREAEWKTTKPRSFNSTLSGKSTFIVFEGIM